MQKGLFTSAVTRCYVLAAFVFLFLVCRPAIVPERAVARGLSVSAGIETGYEWYDREYDRDDDTDEGAVATTTENLTSLADDDYNRLRVAPMVSINTFTARDELTLRYRPGFRYDLDDHDHDVDHNLRVDGLYRLTRDWELRLSESFINADIVDSENSALATDSSDSLLSDSDGRKQYWSNDLSLSSRYDYLEDSYLELRYGLRLYEEDTDSSSGGYDAYARHDGEISVAHHIDEAWRISVMAGYVRGLYDELEDENTAASDLDLAEYRVATILEMNLIEHHPLSLSYNYLGIEYDNPERDDSLLHDFTVNWRYEISQRLSVELGGGPSYFDNEGSGGEWGYNANLGVQYLMEKGSLQLAGHKGYEWENFTGTDENGLRDFYQLRGDFDYNLLQNLQVNIYSLYRYEDIDEIDLNYIEDDSGNTSPSYITTVYNRWRYTVGSSMRFSFMRWYGLSLQYSFSHQDSEQISDSFDEHRVALFLSVEKELFHR